MMIDNEQWKKIAMYLLETWNLRKKNNMEKTEEKTEEVSFDSYHDMYLKYLIELIDNGKWTMVYMLLLQMQNFEENNMGEIEEKIKEKAFMSFDSYQDWYLKNLIDNNQWKLVAMNCLIKLQNFEENNIGETEEKTDKKIKVFVSFDVKNDRNLKCQLSFQAVFPSSLFKLVYWSVQGFITEDWEAEVRTQIKSVDQVIVICGKHTDSAKGVGKELEIAREEKKPYFLLWGRGRQTCKPKTALHNDKIYKWTRRNLKILLGSVRNLPSVPDIPPISEKNIWGNLINSDSKYLLSIWALKYPDHLFDQYKLYIEMTDRISSRRQTTSSFFLSINIALIGFFGYSIVNGPFPDFFFSLITGVGIGLNYLWYRFSRSYGVLNTIKFKIINMLEKRLSLNLYDAEWEAIGRGEKPELYTTFTSIEIVIQQALMIMYGIVFICKLFEINILSVIKELIRS